jgi:Zn-dependent membrane protease YugP
MTVQTGFPSAPLLSLISLWLLVVGLVVRVAITLVLGVVVLADIVVR